MGILPAPKINMSQDPDKYRALNCFMPNLEDYFRTTIA